MFFEMAFCMKTILLVANYRSDVGYAWWLMESYWAKLAQHYSHRYRIVLVYPRITVIPEIIKNSNIECVEFDFNNAPILDVCRFILCYHVSVIYLTDRPTYSTNYALYRFCGVKIIITHDHTPGIRSNSGKLKQISKQMVSRLPFINIDGAFGATDFVRDRLVKINGLPQAKTFSVPNGLPELPVIEPVDLHIAFGIPRKRKVIVMASRASRYKNINFILDCISCLPHETLAKTHFLFIGDGPDLDLFINLAKQLKKQNHCTFAGRRGNVPALLSGADIAFHPSNGEVGYCLAILEYMRAGLPVLVPDNPSVCGATKHGETGFIYNDMDTAIRFLHKLITDDQLRIKIGQQAMDDSTNFSLRKGHSALIFAFDNILINTHAY